MPQFNLILLWIFMNINTTLYLNIWKEFPELYLQIIKIRFCIAKLFLLSLTPSSFVHFLFYVTRFFISLHRFYICLTVNRGIHHFDKLWELTIHLIMEKFSHFLLFKKYILFKWVELNRHQFETINDDDKNYPFTGHCILLLFA